MVVSNVQSLAARVTDQIKHLRQERGISGRELARRIGRSHSWLQNRHRGEQAYDLDDLEKIAEILGVSSEELLGVAAYGSTPRYLPPEVQRLVDQFADDIMSHYMREDIDVPRRRALLRIVKEGWKYVQKGMEYWEAELSRPRVSEPQTRRGRGSR